MSGLASPKTYELMGSRKYPIEDLGAQTISIGLEDEIRLFDRLKITAGVSYDVQNFTRFKLRRNQEYEEQYIVKDDSVLLGTRDSANPVAGLIFDVLKRRLRLRAAGAIKTRFPTLSEYSKVEDSTLDRGLRPERSYNANGGAEIFFMDKAVSLRSDYFLSVINDRIVKISRDDPPI
ncbi:MAG: TonB-dependent receptor, partial [Deltaproteobacteria bacterium]|nr:TonB-dependent receptor [Deltaproteobacteria bacterium]